VQELEDKFRDLGPNKVMAFIAEPVVGAALGCVTAPKGYLKRMKEVCHKHGALFIVDEVMCGMGRTGTLHAWKQHDVVPDIQVIGKGLAGGYEPLAGMLVSKEIVNTLNEEFIHGFTYDASPYASATGLAVQRIIQERNLLLNVSTVGSYLGDKLKENLKDHRNVGDIRGRGLFWGIELVKDKLTKEPFDRESDVANGIRNMGLSNFDILLMVVQMVIKEISS
jgi:adenosylmethionine-8-amino-7-oxononanoate aminotransferase